MLGTLRVCVSTKPGFYKRSGLQVRIRITSFCFFISVLADYYWMAGLTLACGVRHPSTRTAAWPSSASASPRYGLQSFARPRLLLRTAGSVGAMAVVAAARRQGRRHSVHGRTPRDPARHLRRVGFRCAAPTSLRFTIRHKINHARTKIDIQSCFQSSESSLYVLLPVISNESKLGGVQIEN